MSDAAPAGAPPRARLGVDVAAALDLVGSLIIYLGPAALVPAVFAVAHSEPWWPFVVAGAAVMLLGAAMERITPDTPEVGVREGYLVVALVWLIAGLYGALPYVLAGDPQLGRPVDALFEGMSGFTTTGSSAAPDPSSLDVSIQVWRQLTAWMGGIGVVALGLAVLPRLRVGGRQLLESELAGGGVEALSGRIRDTVRRFWQLYLGITAACFLALALPGWLSVDRTMDTYQAFAHTLTTIPTAGFSTETRSMGAFGGLTQWTVTVFMAVAAINYLLLYRAVVQRKPRDAARDEELRLYLLVLLVASAAIAAVIWEAGIASGEPAIRSAAFHVTSAVTATGFGADDYGVWPTFALMALALLLFTGGCAGSTTGSIKMVRHLLLGRHAWTRGGAHGASRAHPAGASARRGRRPADAAGSHLLRPHLRGRVRARRRGAGARVRFRGTAAGALEIVFASAASLGNAGLGVGIAGPQGTFGAFGDVSTIAMCVLMWSGGWRSSPSSCCSTATTGACDRALTGSHRL